MRNMEKLEYITDPARACFLSYHKNENTELPSDMRVVRGDDYKPELYKGFDDTVYTKLILRDKQVDKPVYPEGFKLVTPTKEQLTAHIAQCFPDGETPDSIDLWRYMEYFMVALVDVTTGRIVASAAADVDFGVKEGSIDWVEVSPRYRRKGLGTYLVTELIYRFRRFSDFISVSTKDFAALALFQKCGFSEDCAWHILKAKKIV